MPPSCKLALLLPQALAAAALAVCVVALASISGANGSAASDSPYKPADLPPPLTAAQVRAVALASAGGSSGSRVAGGGDGRQAALAAGIPVDEQYLAEHTEVGHNVFEHPVQCARSGLALHCSGRAATVRLTHAAADWAKRRRHGSRYLQARGSRSRLWTGTGGGKLRR